MGTIPIGFTEKTVKRAERANLRTEISELRTENGQLGTDDWTGFPHRFPQRESAF
jgi:hypothetical protein